MPSDDFDTTLSHISVPLSVLSDLETARQQIKRAELPVYEHDMLRVALDIAEQFGDSVKKTDRSYVVVAFSTLGEELKARKIPGGSIRALGNKCKRLTTAGFFEAIEIENPRGGRNPIRYALQYIHKPDFESKEYRELREQAQGHRNQRTRSNRRMLEYLKESSLQLVTYVKDLRPVTETIFTGLLDRAMRFSSQEKPKGNRITAKVRVKKCDLLVQATCQTGKSSELATLHDQRVIRALLTELAHFIDKQIEKFILEVETPRQATLFGEELEEGIVIDPIDTERDDSSIIEHLEDAEAQDEGIDLETRIERRRARIEAIASDRITNSFFIDTVDIARRMGYDSPHSSSCRRVINASLRRLYETNFRLVIKGDNAKEVMEIMDLFGLDDITTDFRFLPVLKSQFDPSFADHQRGQHAASKSAGKGLKAQHEANTAMGSVSALEEDQVDPYNIEELARVRFWNISIDPHLFRKLKDKESRKLFTAHDDIMKESSGLGQTLYNFFTQTIGRSNQALQGKKPKVFYIPLAHLHDILWPTRRYHRFKDEFIDLMKNYARPGQWDDTLEKNVVCMFGYKFTLTLREYENEAQARRAREKKQLWLRVERDVTDSLAGDNSYYNQKLLKQRREEEERLIRAEEEARG